ncbi:MAG: aldo/keto reductase [Flavitalea sp.]
MKYNQLGNSSLKISEIGFGCMSLGEADKDNNAIISMAIDRGINFFDTADLYHKGRNEITIGHAIKGKRDKIILATKVGNQLKEDGSGWNWNPTKKYILSAVEKSLERLQTDHIDLYQLHGGTIEDPIDETIEAFELLKEQGKIRYYGISSIRPNVIAEYVKRSSIVSVMMQYSLLDRRPEEECLELLKQNNIGVLSRGALAQGLLAGKPAKPYLDLSGEEVKQAASAVQSLSLQNNSMDDKKNGQTGRSAAQTAVRYVLQHPSIASAVIGIRTPEQLQEMVLTTESSIFSMGEMKLLQHSGKRNVYKEHRM